MFANNPFQLRIAINIGKYCVPQTVQLIIYSTIYIIFLFTGYSLYLLVVSFNLLELNFFLLKAWSKL